MLQKRLFIISDGGRFFHYNHVHMTRSTSEGVDGMLRWCAQRAGYDSYTRTVIPLLESITDQFVCTRLGLTPAASGDTARPVPMTCEEPWFQEECELLRLNRVFKSSLASALIWLDAMFYVGLPGKIAVINHPNEEVIIAGFRW